MHPYHKLEVNGGEEFVSFTNGDTHGDTNDYFSKHLQKSDWFIQLKGLPSLESRFEEKKQPIAEQNYKNKANNTTPAEYSLNLKTYLDNDIIKRAKREDKFEYFTNTRQKVEESVAEDQEEDFFLLDVVDTDEELEIPQTAQLNKKETTETSNFRIYFADCTNETGNTSISLEPITSNFDLEENEHVNLLKPNNLTRSKLLKKSNYSQRNNQRSHTISNNDKVLLNGNFSKYLRNQPARIEVEQNNSQVRAQKRKRNISKLEYINSLLSLDTDT